MKDPDNLEPWDWTRMAVADLAVEGIAHEAILDLTIEAETHEQFCAGAEALIELNDIVKDHYERTT